MVNYILILPDLNKNEFFGFCMSKAGLHDLRSKNTQIIKLSLTRHFVL